MDPGPISFIIIIICLILIAILSASEVAFIAANKLKLRHLIEKGNSRAKTVQKIREEHDRFFSAVILSGNLLTILATAIGTAIALNFFQESGIIVATVVMTVLTVVFGELAPKTFAVSHAERIALAMAKPLEIYIKIISPLVWVFNKLSNLIISRVNGGEIKPSSPFLTEEEMKAIGKIFEERGILVRIGG